MHVSNCQGKYLMVCSFRHLHSFIMYMFAARHKAMPEQAAVAVVSVRLLSSV